MTTILFLFLMSSKPQNGMDLFRQRKYAELEQWTAIKSDKTLNYQSRSQSLNLEGCWALRQGTGKENSFLRCLRFVDIQLKLEGRVDERIMGRLNVMCKHLSHRDRFLQSFIQVFKESSLAPYFKLLEPCLDAVWKQFYLTASEKFSADPGGTHSLYLLANSNLPGGERWKKRLHWLGN